jgi:hypothetical protein
MTSSVARSPAIGLYVALAVASLLALVLLALSVWSRPYSLTRHDESAFETDEPPPPSR